MQNVEHILEVEKNLENIKGMISLDQIKIELLKCFESSKKSYTHE